MWMYNSSDDAIWTIRGSFYEGKSMQEMLSLMFKGRTANFPSDTNDTDFSSMKPMMMVSLMLYLFNQFD